VNKIRKEIVESPFKIRDLGIQVIVEPPNAKSPDSVSTEVEQAIQDMLSTIVRTSIDKSDNNANLTDADIENKISVTFQPLLGKATNPSQTTESSFPVWGYIVIGILALVIIVLLILFLRKRREELEVEEEVIETKQEPLYVPDLNEPKETEEMIRKNQIEKMAKEKPDEFVKLIRTWLSQE
jgi:flagellar M-ring protein FliF